MDWMQIVWAIMLVAMLIMVFPMARKAMKNSPKGTSSDWMGFVVPLAAVILFIMLLIALV